MARILFVDDSRDTADAYATLFKMLGHETAVAYDGEQGVEAATAFAPDISFIDLEMPMMDGFEAASAFRERLGRDTILVAVTGKERERVRGEPAGASFDGYLQKPVATSDLVAMVEALPRAALFR